MSSLYFCGNFGTSMKPTVTQRWDLDDGSQCEKALSYKYLIHGGTPGYVRHESFQLHDMSLPVDRELWLLSDTQMVPLIPPTCPTSVQQGFL